MKLITYLTKNRNSKMSFKYSVQIGDKLVRLSDTQIDNLDKIQGKHKRFPTMDSLTQLEAYKRALV